MAMFKSAIYRTHSWTRVAIHRGRHRALQLIFALRIWQLRYPADWPDIIARFDLAVHRLEGPGGLIGHRVGVTDQVR
jgi:hypothetical protein